MAARSRRENFGPSTRVQYSRRCRITSGVKRSAAACRASGSTTARKALSFLRKVMPCRFSSFDEAVAVQTVRDLKRKEAGDPHDHRSQHRVAEVEIIVSKTAALPGEDTVVGVGG